MSQIGAFLQRVRVDEGISAKSVSVSADVHWSHISRVESGERAVTEKVLSAYVRETGHEELWLLMDHELAVVEQIYLDRVQAAKVIRFVNEMKRLPGSLAAEGAI